MATKKHKPFQHITEVARLLDHFMPDEKKDWEKSTGRKKQTHVYHKLLALRSWTLRELGNMADHSITIKIKGGKVVGVDGLPDWWDYMVDRK